MGRGRGRRGAPGFRATQLNADGGELWWSERIRIKFTNMTSRRLDIRQVQKKGGATEVVIREWSPELPDLEGEIDDDDLSD
jgi:hypothetical protein